MEEQRVIINPMPPLHKGRSFFCYRDVNRAIEKHREMFGLRLALKRAIKLENYCLTIEQMKDLNLRLKYGELDYHCFAATGRPGRPGNDERCPQLVRLKLSPDAQSLVVYESHNHNILPSSEITKYFHSTKPKKDLPVMAGDRPTCVAGDITLTPINPVPTLQKTPVLILPKPAPPKPHELSDLSTSPCLTTNILHHNNTSFTPLITLSQSSAFTPTHSTPNSDVNLVTITPTAPPVTVLAPVTASSALSHVPSTATPRTLVSSTSITVPSTATLHTPVPSTPITVPSPVAISTPTALLLTPPVEEKKQPTQNNTNIKLTMKFKKSDVSPNEMVVVGNTHGFQEEPKVKRADNLPINRDSDTPKRELVTSSSEKKLTNSLPQSRLLQTTKLATTESSVVSTPGAKVENPSKAISSSKTTLPKVTSSGTPSPQTSLKTIPSSKPSPGLAQTQRVASPSIKSSLKSPLNSSQKPNLPTKPSTVAKPTVLRQSPNMKQIIIKKSPAVGEKTGPPKPMVGTMKHVGEKNPNLNLKKPLSKPIYNAKLSTTKGITTNSTNSKPAQLQVLNKSGDRVKLASSLTLGEKNTASAVSRQSLPTFRSGGTTGVPSGNKFVNIPRKLKRRPGRPPDSTNSSTGSPSLDTELGFGEKQHLAHGVLLQLLRVTSQLPMVEFSHALDTLEVLTDAYRLGQRVTLSIRHDQEDLSHGDSYGDDLVERLYKSEAKVSSTTSATGENASSASSPLRACQVDGQLDADSLLKSLSTSFDTSLVPSMPHPPPREVMMDVDRPLSRPERERGAQAPCAGVDSPSSSTSAVVTSGNRGPKRPSSMSPSNSRQKRVKF